MDKKGKNSKDIYVHSMNKKLKNLTKIRTQVENDKRNWCQIRFLKIK